MSKHSIYKLSYLFITNKNKNISFFYLVLPVINNLADCANPDKSC